MIYEVRRRWKEIDLRAIGVGLVADLLLSVVMGVLAAMYLVTFQTSNEWFKTFDVTTAIQFASVQIFIVSNLVSLMWGWIVARMARRAAFTNVLITGILQMLINFFSYRGSDPWVFWTNVLTIPLFFAGGYLAVLMRSENRRT